MRFFSFSLLIGGGALIAHLYLFQRLVRPLKLTRRRLVAVGVLLTAMTAFMLLRGPIRHISEDVRYAYEIVAYGWLAIIMGVVPVVIAGDVIAIGLWLRERLKRSKPESATDTAEVVDPARRSLARALPLSVLAGGTLSAAYGTGRAFTPAEISEVPVALPRLPRTLDGLSIAQLTDIHVGNFIGHGFVSRLVEQTNELKPDVVAITGDLVDGDVRELGHAVSALGGLKARHGVYFVTGNHEYYSGVDQWVAYLRRLGITVLRNRRVEIGDDGGKLDLIGVDDWGRRRRRSHGYDLDAALRGRNPDQAAVLLAHQPRNFDEATKKGVGLQISGHTHGGQAFPMTSLIGLAYEYNRGLYREGDTHIYVSRGCGFWGPPARLGSAPEIVKFTLTA